MAERYAGAIGASNLRVHPHKAGSVDLILAAAMHKSGLNTKLARTGAEFDTVRGELERAGHIASAQERKAVRLAKVSFKGTAANGYRDAIDGPSLAHAIREQAIAEAVSARCLIMMQLRTLQPTKDALGAYAILAATKRRFMAPNEVVLKITGKVIEAWLDPLCHECDGTGYVASGYRGQVTKECRPCKGSGQSRSANAGRGSDEQRFAASLLADIQRCIEDFQADLTKRLRTS